MLTVGKAPNGDAEAPGTERRLEPISSETILVDDSYGSIKLMFDLLGNSVRPLKEYKLANIKDIKHLADKYDLPFATRVLGERLWVEVSDGTYSRHSTYGVAMHMRWKSLARYALSRFDDNVLEPIKWPLKTAQEIGLEAWYCLLRAADGCQPFSWKKVAERLEFPEE